MSGDNGLDLFGRPSTADTGERNDLDYYETPEWATASLLAHHRMDREDLILEPACGDGAIVRALQAAGFSRIMTNDIDPRHPANRHRDAADPAFWHMKTIQEVDHVVTNLPFDVAFPILEQAEIVAKGSVCLLLRLSFLEPTRERGEWLALHPPSRIINLPRHSFRGSGNDTVTCAWFVWERIERRRVRPPIVIDHMAKSRRVSA